MHTIDVRNVHEALPEGIHHLHHYGVRTESRVGDVLVSPGPVMTVYRNPTERVLFWPERDANPFFHLMEALWMLAGRQDVAWLERFNSHMWAFSDDGIKFHGAYGFRWRNHFMEDYGVDQLEYVVRLLSNNPKTRRAVIQMWDAPEDLCVDEKTASLDIPCNTHIYLRVRDVGPDRRVLDMTVCCRSNDIIWGAYGANAVHFSVLQEYLAAKLGLYVGILYQLSNNYHAYVDIFEKMDSLKDEIRDPHRTVDHNPYRKGGPVHIPLVINPETFMAELDEFMKNESTSFGGLVFENTFLNYAVVLRNVYLEYKETKDATLAIQKIATDTPSVGDQLWDFRLAAHEWMWRRGHSDDKS